MMLVSQEDDVEVQKASYYTVFVYKHNGLGSEAEYNNVLATSCENACEYVAGSHPHLRLNPMVAHKQYCRTF